MRKKHVKYDEGQWFLVPLQTTGYALGVIVRGNYQTKGGLGYFFDCWFADLPAQIDISKLQPSDAVLIAWFGDLEIISGKWPLLTTNNIFDKKDWPVPKFGRADALNPEKGWLVEYEQDNPQYGLPLKESRCDVIELADFPKDGLSGAHALEHKLTALVKENSN